MGFVKKLLKRSVLLIIPAILVIAGLGFGGDRALPDGIGGAAELVEAIGNKKPLAVRRSGSGIAVVPKKTARLFERAMADDISGYERYLSPGEPVNVRTEGRKKYADINLNTAFTDTLVHSTGENYYSLTVSKRGALFFTFGADYTGTSEKSCLWRVSLERVRTGDDGRESYTEILTARAVKSGEAIRSPAAGVLPGSYRITVRCVNGYEDNTFGLAAVFAESSSYETEPNDTRTRYTYLPRDKVITGSSSLYADGSNDTDFYMTEVTKKGFLSVYFSHDDLKEISDGTFPDQVGYAVTVTGADGEEYYSVSSLVEDATIQGGVIGVEPGCYFVEVRTAFANNKSYRIAVNFNASDTAETEFNDTVQTADALENSAVVTGSLSRRSGRADVDCYRLDIGSTAMLAVSFAHAPDTSKDYGGWNVKVTDSGGNTLYRVISHWADESIVSPYIGVGAGTYYVVVDSDNMHFNETSYDLIAGWAETGYLETEPNDTTDTADLLPVGSYAGGALIERGTDFDTDIYRVDVTAPMSLDIAFSHPQTGGQREAWTVTLKDPGGKTVVSVGVKQSDPGTISFTTPMIHVGTYYLYVESGLYYSTDTYAVAVYEHSQN